MPNDTSFSVNDAVTAAHKSLGQGVVKGEPGLVVHCYDDGCYEVEFEPNDGQRITMTVSPGDLEKRVG